MREFRDIHLVGATGAPRSERIGDEEYLVVPVVALMEGVIHAVNAETPEYVSKERLAAAASSWNGRPLVIGHPTKNGAQISANDPAILAAQGFGTVYTSQMKGSKLGMEAWISPKRLQALGEHALLDRVKKGDPIEVSVGAFVRTLEKSGVWNGKNYKAEWDSITGDHLAFLPNGRGACSLEMGCGACRAAEAYRVGEEALVALEWNADE